MARTCKDPRRQYAVLYYLYIVTPCICFSSFLALQRLLSE